MNDIDVVILAAGKGTRLKDGIAKPLHKVAGLTMLEHVVNAARMVDPYKVIIVQSPRDDYSKFGDEVVTQTEQLGSGHALSIALDAVSSEKVLVLNADMPLITGELLQEIVQKDDAILAGIFDDPTGYGRIIATPDQRVAEIVEEKDATPNEKKITLINSGVYLFNTNKVRHELESVSNDNAQGEFYLTDAAVGLNIVVVKDSQELQGVNNQQQLAQVNKIMRGRINDRHMTNGVIMIDPETTYIDELVTIGAGTTIKPNTVIEGVSSIGEFNEIGPNAHIRPNTTTGKNVHIGNFVETKNATIGDFTKIGHLTYVGDAQVGQAVNIGAGTIFVNYDGKNKHTTRVGNRAFIGSNTKLVAPVNIAEESITAAGSTIDHDVEKHSMGIARARQTNKPDFWNRMEHEDFREEK
ncbi:MAG: NTP transferase domain-containing protein [Lactobacillaceae bacterium]|jgi:bifunctional UDP-N-acetylglucosamine pyrophosphorylase/glucosamine-1-phosphate N-acetyltransferase|nr:NTP transferase domain-containing protein [Lactobacillaceae bacterium]